ncbi:adenosine deaminase [Paraflavitalea sp. CAU 1676]|uniref:adenosine deaminase n=1 Tax=Paraflavitalea sp. CAU 1676 TaxID=3032598 RepID=UPI0023D9B60A|nr:adenosine deaminase [Paraflavitalea sp. CAU 1676]MDF2193567.1 adenosine deaminase [Paraflavitalea sp. CAU 1676]
MNLSLQQDAMAQGNAAPPFAALPKVELHHHMDCSLSYEVVQKLAPDITYETYQREFIAPAKCTDLADYITRAIKAVNLMQTEEQLRLVTLDVIRQLKKDNVIYGELRFAPLQHLQKGLTSQQVVRIVNKAVEDGMRENGIELGVILCTLRHYSEAQSMETVKLVEQFKGTHIVGFDIAADEAGFPITNHVAAFKYAHEKGLPCTAHAGEAKGAASVWETLKHFGPTRIGHGVRSSEDDSLMAYLKKHNIHLEVCATSNIQTAIYNTIADHTVNKIYQSGVSMSVNTDARTISNVSLSSEYELLHRVFNWEQAQFLRCNLEAIDHAFTTDAVKQKIRQQLLAAYRPSR